MHNLESLTFDRNTLFLKVDGQTLTIPLHEAFKKLAMAEGIKNSLAIDHLIKLSQ